MSAAFPAAPTANLAAGEPGRAGASRAYRGRPDPVYRTGHLDVKRYADRVNRHPAHGDGTLDGAGADARAAHAAPLLRDEVDGIVAAWRAQRPDLDVEPLHVLSRISRLARHLDRARRAAFASHGLESWEFDVLSALRRQGPPYQMTPGALLRATLVTSGTMTNRIDRLAAAGLVRRLPDPRDKRGVLVTLTDQGMAKADGALAALLSRERNLLAALDDGEQRVLAGLLRTLLAPFDAAQAE
jgi:DNA-binding MarR family transcriptional regulator